MTEQERNFYRDKAGIPEPVNRTASTHGVLYLNGQAVTQPLPYALLQHKKKELIQQGYTAKQLKIHRY